MSSFQRIGQFTQGFFMLLCCIILLAIPEYYSTRIVALVLSLALMAYGIRTLVYYFTMARHMVGGNAMLFVGIIAFDLGALVLILSDQPQYSLMLYLVGTNGFMGLVGILRSIERKKIGGKWVSSLVNSILRLLIVVACIAFFNSGDTLILILAIGLGLSAFGHFGAAFRKPELIFIQ